VIHCVHTRSLRSLAAPSSANETKITGPNNRASRRNGCPSRKASSRHGRRARRLRDGDSTVRQIADEVGYDSEFAFARAFKRATGSAPGQYRKLSSMSGS
jgi:hypothetical protein